MFKITPELLKDCKNSIEELSNLLVDELHRNPMEKKELIRKIKKAQETLHKLKTAKNE